MSGNQALNVNYGIGGVPDIQITVHGSDWYFTVCAIMTVSTFAFLGMSFMKARSERLFHYITAAITLVAAIAYFSMGSNLGQVPIPVQYTRQGDGTREIFYVRYIDWFVTTPLLLLDLLLTAGLPWPTIVITILMDEVMIVTGLVGALIPTNYKWGYFTFGCVALFYVVYQLVFVARLHAVALGPNVSRVYNTTAILTLVLWFLYPIAWGLCEGSNYLHPDSEAVFYGVLDVFAKPVFGFLLIAGHRSITLAELGIHIRDYDEMPTRDGVGHGHKEGVSNGQGATTTVV